MSNPFDNPEEFFEEGEATAPGDIPMPMIDMRVALLSRQFRHDNTIRPYAPKAGESVIVTATSGLEVDVDRVEIWFTTDGRLPDRGAQRLSMTVQTISWRPHTGYLTHWEVEIPGQSAATAVRYRIAGWKAGAAADAPPDFFAMDGQGFWSTLNDPSPITTFAYYVEPDAPLAPDWMAETVMYHIFLDRYHPGTADGRFPDNLDPHGKHGGTIRGVTQTLPYLEELGINCIWLSPINISPTYHRYDATDYYEIDPELGTDEDLRTLIDEAHGRGMRVILDFVPSHLSWNHPAFVAAKADQSAETASWFVFTEWPDQYRSFLNLVPELVSIDTNSGGARKYLIDNAIYWIEKFGMDGFRLDHAIGHGMDFWVEFRQALQAVKPDVVTIGEVTDSPDALQRYRGRLTHILDFPLASAFRYLFALDRWDVGRFDRFLRSYETFMAEGAGRASFLDNHDMNRFLFMTGNDKQRLKLAAVCQFTLTPTPVLYYGTEIGMSQTLDKDAGGFGGDHVVRADMPWDQAEWDHNLLAFYRQLIQIRRERGDWSSKKRTVFQVTEQLYGYLIDDLAVVFNLNDDERALNWDGFIGATLLLSTGAEPEITNDEIRLGGKSGAVLKIINSH